MARQIAEALEAAHDQGIVHRDLKPANIKIRPDGTVKVLDFGLAKAMDPAGASSANAMNSPTLSLHATQAGIILGTAAYMSPEQARGKTVDRRSDIWAFGSVLFEMLTGVRAFPGDDATDTIVSVVSRDPDWNGLTPAVPAGIRRLLRRCLEKDPKRRLDSAAAVRIEIDEALTALPVDANPAGPPTPARRAPAVNRSTQLLPWGIATAALAIAVAVAWRGVDRERPAPVYASLDAPADHVLGEDDGIVSLPTRTPMVFTPDGRSLIIQAARAGKPQLFLRSLDRPDARPIAGTDDARVPFVSPDGKWVGFWTANEIRKVLIEGGPATTVCPLKAMLGPFGAAWGRGDLIVFGDDASGRIMRVPANGGTPAPVTAKPGIGRQHAAPFFFPDGKRILYSDVSTSDVKDSRLMVQSLDGGDARLVIASAVDGRLLPSGQLLFMRLGALMTVPFDAARAEAKGDAVVAIGGVMQSGLLRRAGAENTAAGMFAVSSLGTLAFVRGSLIGPGASRMIWATRDGRSSSAEPGTGDPGGGRFYARISPDRSRAIVGVSTPMRLEMWLADWTRDAWTRCSDCNSEGALGVWSPDGGRLLLGRKDTLVAHTIDGSAPDELVVREGGRVLVPSGWLADGRIVYQSSPDLTNNEIKFLETDGHTGRVVVPLGIGSEPEVSPDGRWLAYDSTQTGALEVVVQAFPGPGARAQISVGGGSNPAWSADGRTLYHLRRTETFGTVVLAIDIAPSARLTAGKPRELLRRPDSQRCVGARCYDISADGQRFLFFDRTAEEHVSVTRMNLILNWAATLSNGR
jgi:Tol biopolymer transport system component